jgi:hypothetical protein
LDERWRGCDEPTMRRNKSAVVKLNGKVAWSVEMVKWCEKW